MKLFEPQVQLLRQVNVDGPDSFFLHAVTFCDRTCYRSGGYAPLPAGPDENGDFVVDLYLEESADTDGDYHLLTPVVHSLSLGEIPFPDGEGNVLVNMILVTAGESRNTEEQTKEGQKKEGRTVGKRTVGSTGALDDSRPML